MAPLRFDGSTRSVRLWPIFRLRTHWPRKAQCSSIVKASQILGAWLIKRGGHDAELRRNSRARSAVLHVHRKSRGTRLSDLEAKAGAALNWAPHIIPVPAEQRAGWHRWGAGAGKKKKKRDDTPEEEGEGRRRQEGPRRWLQQADRNDVKPEAQPFDSTTERSLT